MKVYPGNLACSTTLLGRYRAAATKQEMDKGIYLEGVEFKHPSLGLVIDTAKSGMVCCLLFGGSAGWLFTAGLRKVA